MVLEWLSAGELDDEVRSIMNAFFTQSEPSKAAGRAYLERLKLRVENRDAPVSKQAALAELAAIREWGVIPQADRFAMLGQIHHPTLVVHGSKDVVGMPINAFSLSIARMLSSSCTRMPIRRRYLLDPNLVATTTLQRADVA